MLTEIKNAPEYAFNKKFVVARECDGDLWFYAAFDDVDKAISCAMEVNGEVIPTSPDCSECEVTI